jgi:hypothetical protein
LWIAAGRCVAPLDNRLSAQALLLGMHYRRDFFRLREKTSAEQLRALNPETVRPIDSASSYDEFRRLLNQRRVEHGMTFADLDARSGLADGYSSKILSSPVSAHGRYCRNIGPTAMDCLLASLKVRLRLEPIDE